MNNLPAAASKNTTSKMGGGNDKDKDKDMLDRGVEGVEQKMGLGGQTEKMRGVNESATDSARGMFEKGTGKKVPEKFSK